MKGNYRYTVLGLLFLATTINYIDRQIIGLLKAHPGKRISLDRAGLCQYCFLVSADVCNWLFAGRKICG